MAQRRSKLTIILCAAVLLAVGIVIFYSYGRYSLHARVEKILLRDMMPRKGKWDEGMAELWALGPGIAPCLAEEAGRRDTFFSKKYAQLYQKSPGWLQRYLPQPIDRAELRLTAIHAIADFGPVTARAAAPQIIALLKVHDINQHNYAMSCMRWLVPESKPALAALKSGLAGSDTNWLPPETFLGLADGSAGDNSTWTRIPDVLPLVTNFLNDPDDAYMAAIPLGRMGTNAALAIPALIQTADIGAAGFSSADDARSNVANVFVPGPRSPKAERDEQDKKLNHNRAMAALALGRIGIASPEVRAALARAWNFPDPWVRHNAAEAVALLGFPMTNELPALLKGLRDEDNSALDTKLQAIRKLGPGAREALATLRELTQTNVLLSLVTNKDTRVVGWSITDLSASAKTAICGLDPGEGRPFLPAIAGQIGRTWDSVVFLGEQNSLSNDIVRTVTPLLEETNKIRQTLAAYVILRNDKQNAQALAVLHQEKSTGDLNQRLLAARLLYLATGDTNGLCAVIAEAFQDPRSFLGQGAGQLAEKMGTNALPALPAIKAALWHKDKFVRERAGVLILKLAPEELPINEPK